MKKIFIFCLFVTIVTVIIKETDWSSWSDIDDGYTKANLELTTGCFMNSDGMIITLTKNTYHWNKHILSSLEWNLIRSSTDRAYSIKADIDLDIQDGFEASIEYNPELKRYRFNRIIRGVIKDLEVIEYWTKVDCP